MALDLVGIAKRYGPVEVLPPLDLTVTHGEFLTLLGPSGSGKTTVLRLIGGFLEPSGGRILFNGQDITRLPANRRPFNTVFQDYALFPHMTVAQNIGYGPRVQGKAGPETARKMQEILSVVGLEGLEARYPAQLSGGQRQRVALARAILCEPAVLLLDEPLAALDASLRRQAQAFLKQVQRQIRTSFLFVTHDQEEAISLSDRIVVMNRGRIEQIGPPRDLYAHPASAFVAGFFGSSSLLPGPLRNGPEGLRVETAAGALPVGGVAPGLQPGGQALLCLRPETLRLLPPDAPEAKMSGRVRRHLYLGAATQVSVALPGGLEVEALLPGGAETLPPAEGAPVGLGYDPAAAWAVAAAS